MLKKRNTHSITRQKKGRVSYHVKGKFIPLDPIDFNRTNDLARIFADHIEECFEELTDILLEYESYEVIQDETARTLDVLRSLSENKKYFVLRVDQITSFLPKNQPLYALTCFVLIPSLMSSEVHFRAPYCMRNFYGRFLRVLKINYFFPNVFVSHKERLKFLSERSALRINSVTKESIPISDVVIFTGSPNHAERLRLIFDHRTLVISNGSGHNPIVVSGDADIVKAVEATLTLQLYNQGQDCAAPNSILVHSRAFRSFLDLLKEELRKVRVGLYRDRSCKVGPISEPEELKRIQAILTDNRRWIYSGTPGIIHATSCIVEPTIISKPLLEGGNFAELFAPIFFVQIYKKDSELSLYFESPHYARNAMYITLFGTSNYVKKIINRSIGGKVLHEKNSLLHNTHLHAPGIERGTQPYGGNGFAASNLSINGKIVCKATLPQRDIYQWVVEPLLRKNGTIEQRKLLRKDANIIVKKDIRKLMGLKVPKIFEKNGNNFSEGFYVDTQNLCKITQRYVFINTDAVSILLSSPNVTQISAMEPIHIHQIRILHKFLKTHGKIGPKKLLQVLYSIPKDLDLTEDKNRANQLKFFHNIYQLLFGKDSGPRLGQFLAVVNRQQVLHLLDI